MGLGRVTQVMGPVIDVRFEHNEVPEINNALVLDIEREEGNVELTLEVALQLGDDVVRTIAMDSTDGVKRGTEVRDSGNSIRSEEHTSELQSRFDLVCRLLLEKKK